MSAIDLAREADFRLGGLLVRPSRREAGEGEARRVLEPRVMQAIVALARQPDEVVSRDELIESCWGGRIVGDDAINNCLAKVRRLGEASGAFEIETVPRVGYRLTPAGADAASTPEPPPRPAAAAPAASDDNMLLAVLPFENLSPDPELSFFSEGVAHIGLQVGYYVFQNTTVPWQANSRYTLTVGMGNRNATFSASSSQFSRAIFWASMQSPATKLPRGMKQRPAPKRLCSRSSLTFRDVP